MADLLPEPGTHSTNEQLALSATHLFTQCSALLILDAAVRFSDLGMNPLQRSRPFSTTLHSTGVPLTSSSWSSATTKKKTVGGDSWTYKGVACACAHAAFSCRCAMITDSGRWYLMRAELAVA